MSKIPGSSAGTASEGGDAVVASSSQRGIYRELEDEHGRIAALMSELRAGNVNTRANLLPIIRAELLAHSVAEQAVFYTVLRSYNDSHDLVTELLREHRHIEELLRELEATDDMAGARREELYGQLVDRVQDHVGREEGELFPIARRILSDEQAEEMERRFQEQQSRELERFMRGVGLLDHGEGSGTRTPHSL